MKNLIMIFRMPSAEKASIYEHCIRAIRRAYPVGEHGIPLMGSGDWNDGMDMIGRHGKGESVWLGFFLYDTLNRFMQIAELRQDAAFVAECHEHTAALKQHINDNAWDGNWYRRAYFDDGTPLGSASNDECQIDSIAQSWSVLSGAGLPDRTTTAMDSVNKRLVRRDIKLLQLLDPPFDKSALNPGYIKGYVPGVRENGGQYTHAAIWMIMAFAAMGDKDRAWELFEIINPINHGSTPDEVFVYKVEPYVMAADVYASPQHKGRGGWTWYTGSSGWMYELIMESLLGLTVHSDRLSFHPCFPKNWSGFKVTYRYRTSVYKIDLTPGDSRKVLLDGVEQNENFVVMTDDNREHVVELVCD